MIRITTPAAFYDDAVAEALRVYNGQGGEISDESARALAMAWQSPGTVGHVLASLASGVPTSGPALMDDISNTFAHDKPQGDDHLALGCLATWVLNHPDYRED